MLQLSHGGHLRFHGVVNMTSDDLDLLMDTKRGCFSFKYTSRTPL